MINEQVVEEVLQGQLEASKWAIPRQTKIYICSTKSDFLEERRTLLENVGPELQSMYDSTGLEVELVDVHFGTGGDVLQDPHRFADQLEEIRQCYQVSRGCFFLVLIGNERQDCPLPVTFTQEDYEQLTETAKQLNLEVNLVHHCYKYDGSNYHLVQESTEQAEVFSKAFNILRAAAQDLTSRTPSVIFPQLLRSAVEHQFHTALDLDPDHIVAVVREFTDCPEPKDQTLNDFKQVVVSSLPEENILQFVVPWKNSGIDTEWPEHDTYLTDFQDVATSLLQSLINKSIEEKPEINAKTKQIQEVFKEALFHLALCNQYTCGRLPTVEWRGTPTLDRIRDLMTGASARHGPILVQGGYGSGKTSLLTTIYTECESWFGRKVMKVLRFSGITPRSSYNLELLRIICEQLCLLLQPAQSSLCVPQDASFDPLYINNWFQTLIRRFDEESQERDPAESHLLVILIDDIHRLNPLDSDIVAALSWLPINLPRNVHIIGTTHTSPDVLKLTPVQRERFKHSECYIELPPVTEDLERQAEEALEAVEAHFGMAAMSRLGSMLTAAEFGLSETELLELLMPTAGPSTAELLLQDGQYNFSTFTMVRRSIGHLLLEKFMSGRILLCWRYELLAKVAKKRYLTSQEITRSIHGDIANLFFSDFPTDLEPIKVEEALGQVEEGKQTPFQSAFVTNDVTYSLRHVEESWIHLLKAGDSKRLKQLTICNFDWLLAAVRTISVSYLRSTLEHVRCYLLDRDVELVYYTVRKSSDVLTRDTLQLAAQIICWLRPVAESSGALMSRMILAAMAWCDGYTDPLLVPLNGWLQPPLPLQIKSVVCPGGVGLIAPTPSAQHVVVVTLTGETQLWHIMSNTLIHTFKGHSGPVLCLAVTKQSHFLLTGSEDTSIIVWDLSTFEQKMRIYEHIAPVLSVTPALDNTVVVSGGEDSRIIVTSLKTREVVVKIDHHRGPVTAVHVTASGDILISGSSDKSVCLWSLDNFTLLNSISVPSPVSMLDISSDSVFLLVACEDNQLYLHTLATGTQIHCLRGHKANVESVCLAGDNQRAVAGGSDGRVYVFDMHSGCLVRTISTSHNAKVTGVKVTSSDDFLITAGGNRITSWSFRKEDGIGVEEVGTTMTSKSSSTQKPHTAPINCLDISRDGTTAVTGGLDSLVNVWQLNSHDLHSTMEGHSAAVTAVAISPNGLFTISGSEDKTARVWGLTLGLVVSIFKGHQATVTAVGVMSDSRRVVSCDRQGVLAVWLADNATLLHSALGPTNYLQITNNMKYAVSGDGDNSLRIWPLTSHRDEERFTISHTKEVTCFVLTADSLHVVTGSRDASLKVWQVIGGKLTQVLMGHTDHVTCVAVAITNKTIVVSGSRDNNLIVWDINTGNDIHLLSGHLGCVTCVKVAGDGSVAVSGSEDKRIITWDTAKGVPLSSLQLHLPILGLVMSTDATRIAVHLFESRHLPIICLHNTPATYVKAPVYVAPAKEIEDLRPSGPKRPLRRLLKKEVSLDTYTWQKKYGHLTSSIMMAAVDERLKRRFSVSASMEEISKIPASKEQLGSQNIGPEQAALAQSQHFDQLEAMWNRRSPPRPRRLFQSLSKQNSRTSRKDSEEDNSPLEEVDDFSGD